MNGYKTALIFDTETTGLPYQGKPLNHESQPRVIQLAAALYAKEENKEEAEWERVSILYTLIDSEGSEVNPKAQEVHGISKEKAYALGTTQCNSVYLFLDLCEVADEVVAHNAVFDQTLMNIALAREGVTENPFEDKLVCTMKPLTNVVKAKKAGRSGYKWPSLEECMQYYFSESVGTDAHDAMVDVDACARVFFEARKRGDL